jgi:cytochrome c
MTRLNRNTAARRPRIERMRVLLAGLAVALASADAFALTPSEQRGLNIARTYCARCHSIDKVSESPLRIAPPFRTLHERYPVTNLQEPLGEGIVTGHPSMPEFRFEPDQVHDFIEFLKTLQ